MRQSENTIYTGSMNKENRYTVKQLHREFGTNEQCLEFLFLARHTRECSCGGTYVRTHGRRKYNCSNCAHQIAPTAGTIFHRSKTPLPYWFHAMYLFSQAKTGLAATELQRQIGCTYKTAWRMLAVIRSTLHTEIELDGIVEMDEAYFGGKQRRIGSNNEYNKVGNKAAVVGAVKRGGKMVHRVVPNVKVDVIQGFLHKTVLRGSTLHTDGSSRYKNITKRYTHSAVNHNKGEYVRGTVHTNNIEVFWSNVKRSLKGTHRVISPEHLQSYLDGFAFHYNNRHSDRKRFFSLLCVASLSCTKDV